MSVSYSMGFSYEEKAELLALVSSSPKWTERVNGAHGCLINTVPQIQPFHYIGTGVNDKWHNPLYRDHNASWMGKRVKVVHGDCEVSIPTCLNKSGVITGWHDFIDRTPGFQCILPASCYHMAVVSGDNGETFYANTSWCSILS